MGPPLFQGSRVPHCKPEAGPCKPASKLPAGCQRPLSTSTLHTGCQAQGKAMSKQNPPCRQSEERRTRDPETKASVSYLLPLLLFMGSGHEQQRQTEMGGTKVGKSINRYTETRFRVISHLPWSPASHACHSKRQTHLKSEMEPLR